ncbi:prevent-host-death protein [Candidatus Electronema sp. JM]|uniref:prevent-host-death protein n=1 Tax=Candidatus Electronema sp. JM TaxID=3401571 RepID=UPI003AA96DA4
MKTFSYIEAAKNFSDLLNLACSEEIEIIRDGVVFSVVSKEKRPASPFDVLGIRTNVTSEDILNAVSESRSR